MVRPYGELLVRRHGVGPGLLVVRPFLTCPLVNLSMTIARPRPR